MRGASVAGFVLLAAACAAGAQPPPPTLAGPRSERIRADPGPVVEADATSDETVSFTEDSRLEQGGLAFGRTSPGAIVALDGEEVMVDEEGRFVIGFGQFAEPEAMLNISLPDGRSLQRTLTVAERTFEFGGTIDVPANQVNQFTEVELAHIARSSAAKNEARALPPRRAADYVGGFVWPAEGFVSSRFGKFRRYTNGDIVSPHSGVDVAAPRAPGGGPAFNFTGADVVAPAAGVVTLAEPDMFFEGGLILIDHGHKLETAIMHLSSIDVEAGQTVARGERIGSAGSTGRSTGPHVHWSVKWNGKLVDPERLVGPMGTRDQ